MLILYYNYIYQLFFVVKQLEQKEYKEQNLNSNLDSVKIFKGLYNLF